MGKLGGASSQRADVEASESRRVLKLIDFLSDYDAIKNPPVHNIKDYGLFLKDRENVPDVKGISVHEAADVWLTVDFLEFPPRPEVPHELVELLGQSRYLNPHLEPTLVDLESHESDDDEAAERLEYARLWIEEEWRPWSEEHKEVEVSKMFYRDLFEAGQKQANERESVELVWGFGRLSWETEGVSVNHPLLTIPVEVTRDEDTQQLSVAAAGAVELQTQCFTNMTLHDRSGLIAMRDAIAGAPPDPWSPDITETYRSAVRALNMNGTVAEDHRAEPGAPVSDTGWVFYMRRRRPDYQGFLDGMRNLYREARPPAPLVSTVVEAPSELEDSGRYSEGTTPASTTEGVATSRSMDPLFLPLPANEEQIQILEKAQHRIGVTVQGPPGTGKSHTIANLISHYVSYGNRVLVVSEKEQALRVLADKIPAGIRDLAVSVLGADDESRKSLEGSITQIQTRVSTLDVGAYDAEIVRLTGELNKLDKRIAKTTDTLLGERRAEVNNLSGNWPCGLDPTPQTAAAWVADNAGELSFIPDEIDPGQEIPVSQGDVAELVRLIETVGVERAEACAFVLPDLSELPDVGDLASTDARVEILEEVLEAVQPELRNWTKFDTADPERLPEAIEVARHELERFEAASSGWLSALREQLNDPVLMVEWNTFWNALTRDREQIIALRRPLAAHEISVPTNAGPEFVEQLEAAREMLQAKGKLGLFAGKAKGALAECRVDGHQPSNVDQVGICIAALHVERCRRAIRNSWASYVGHLGAPDLPESFPENALGPHLESVGGLLTEKERWAGFATKLTKLGISVAKKPDLATIQRTLEVLELAVKRPKLLELRGKKQRWIDYLESGKDHPDASQLWDKLLHAVLTGTPESYDVAYARVVELSEIAPSALRLREISSRLSTCAPQFCQQLLAEGDANINVSDVDMAWKWRQLETWVSSVSNGPSPAKLQATLEELSQRRRRTISELVERRAWRRLKDSLGDQQKQALNAYLQATKRFGKTGGKYAARWQQQIREALNESKAAVPVWIMTKDKALTSFRPDVNPPFDILIIDEASQIGIEAIPLLSLARKSIIVGDDKQVSADSVGLAQQAVFNLLDDHLSEVPLYKTLFDPNTSLYDLAIQKFPDIVTLTEHFRCLPAIIEFSSQMSYNGRIEPLRDRPPHPGWKPLGSVKVTDGFRSGSINEPEANAVVDLIQRLDADPQYEGMTFGVVSLLGSDQGELLRGKLFDRFGPSIFTERQLRVGEPPNFQGDERDVIIVSTVVATDPNKPTARLGSMTSLRDQRRVNVAASRAKQQMWVVHSVDPDRLSPGDFRAALIRHAQSAESTREVRTDLEERCDSQFEKDVVRRILNRGYRAVDVQYRVGAENRGFRIDIVVEGPETRLAVECDGDRWHGEDRWYADRTRQEVLERAGWTFWRVRGSTFYRNPDDALEGLWERLDELGIPTGDQWIADERAGQTQVLEVAGQSADADTAWWEEELEQGSGQGAQEIVDHTNPQAPRSPAATIAPRDPDVAVTQEEMIDGAAEHKGSRHLHAAGNPPAGDVAGDDQERSETTSSGLPSFGRNRPSVSVQVPAGYEQVGWIRPYEADAVLAAYRTRQDVRTMDPNGNAVGIAAYRDPTSEEARRFHASVELIRSNGRGARTVAWIRPDEATDILAADSLERDVEQVGDTHRDSHLVKYYPPTSDEAVTYRSTTRLHRPLPPATER